MTMRIALPYIYTRSKICIEVDVCRCRLDGGVAAGAYFDNLNKQWNCYWGNSINSIPNAPQQTMQEAMDFIDAWLLSNDEYLL